jgi:hypothetical protein
LGRKPKGGPSKGFFPFFHGGTTLSRYGAGKSHSYLEELLNMKRGCSKKTGYVYDIRGYVGDCFSNKNDNCGRGDLRPSTYHPPFKYKNGNSTSPNEN